MGLIEVYGGLYLTLNPKPKIRFVGADVAGKASVSLRLPCILNDGNNLRQL